jgi:hypothetical protein
MSKVNGHTAEQVVEAIKKNHGLLAAAAADLHVSRTTVYNYVKRYPTIRQAMEEARESVLDMAESQLYKAVKNGSIPAIMFLLKTVGRTRGYVERQEIIGDITSKGDKLEVRPIDYRTSVAPLAPRPVADSAAPGEDQSPVDGSEMG